MKLLLILVVIAINILFVFPASAITFTDVTKKAGLEWPMADLWGSGFADFNNDGYLDLYVVGWSGFNPLFMNNKDGTFTECSKKAGLDHNGSIGPAFADYDNDGFTDIYITANQGGNRLYHKEGDGTFSEVGQKAGVNFSGESWGAVFFDYDKDGFLDLYLANGALNPTRNILYRNQGDGTFKDVTKQANIEYIGKGQAVVISDYDNDGFPDIFLRCYNTNGVIFHNEGDGSFKDVTKDLIPGGFGIQALFFADYDNDGDIDIISNTNLYQNDGNCKYVDVTDKSGWKPTGTAIPSFVDFDNDGYMDILCRSPSSNYAVLYQNNGDSTFIDITKQAGLEKPKARNLNNCPAGDYDNDGFLDIYASYGTKGVGGPNVLYRNNGNDNHWLHLKLIGVKSNKSAIGAKVKVTAGGMTQLRELSAGGRFSQDILDVEFGLGKSEFADRIEIIWPSGVITRLSNIPADQKLTITEGESSSIQPQGKLTTNWGRIKNTRLFQNYPNPFNPETWIPFQLGEDSEVSIKIYNVSGQVIKILDMGYMKAGSYTSKELSAYWDGKTDAGEKVPSGLYFYELGAKGSSSTKKMIVIR